MTDDNNRFNKTIDASQDTSREALITKAEWQLQELTKLIESYELNRDQVKSKDYNETALRVQFINPFLEILGWDVNNAKRLPIYSCEVIHEASVDVEENDESKNKKPDYAFRVGNETRFFLETCFAGTAGRG